MIDSFDVVVIGSGSAGCTAALRAARGGLRVLVIEKSPWLGGTSAMSGAGVWIPANHVAAEAGVSDSVEEANDYLVAVSPEGWEAVEGPLWRAFVDNAPPMLRFVASNSPLDFRIVNQSDPFAAAPGAKLVGRVVSPMPLSRNLLGALSRKMRRSTLPHLFSYQEIVHRDIYHHPLRAGLGLWPRLLWRWITNSGGQGTALMVGLVKGCRDAGVVFWLESRAVGLVQDAEGRVGGVEIERAGTRLAVPAQRGVVIASGGFEWDSRMRETHFPGPIDRLGSPQQNEGDGQKLASAAGAQLDRMDQANIYPCLPTRYEGLSYGLPMTFQTEPHSIVVDRTGRRFVSETDFNLGEAMDRRDPDGKPSRLPCYLIGDQRFLGASLAFRWYASYERGWVRRADTIAGLAAQLGLPPSQLEETVARWNRFCNEGRDADFNRGEGGGKASFRGKASRLKPIDRPPYVGMTLNRCILGTKGGARTNAKAQVLRPDGSVIAGLYAAGLAMANPIGTRAVGAATTLGPNMTWGYIAAQTMLQQNQ